MHYQTIHAGIDVTDLDHLPPIGEFAFQLQSSDYFSSVIKIEFHREHYQKMVAICDNGKTLVALGSRVWDLAVALWDSRFVMTFNPGVINLFGLVTLLLAIQGHRFPRGSISEWIREGCGFTEQVSMCLLKNFHPKQVTPWYRIGWVAKLVIGEKNIKQIWDSTVSTFFFVVQIDGNSFSLISKNYLVPADTAGSHTCPLLQRSFTYLC